MNKSKEVCGARKDCQFEVVYACTCGDPVVFICRDCMCNHLFEPSAHIFISLEQARELLMNRIGSKDFTKTFEKYNKAKIEVQAYLKRIATYKLQVENSKYELISLIENKCQTATDCLTGFEEKAEGLLKNIKIKMKSFTITRDDLLIQFEAKGLCGIVENYIEKLEVKQMQVKNAIDKMITIISSSSKIDIIREPKHTTDVSMKDLIFIPKEQTKILASYDSQYNTIQEYDLNSVVKKPFDFTSACKLPNGNVMIVGSKYGTYRFNTETGVCIKLNGLNFPRGGAHLYCHGKYIYALGGKHESPSDKAERMEWKGNGWENLPNLKEARGYFGSYYSENRLYLFGGDWSCTVEYYDFRENTFNLLRDIRVPKGANVVGVLDDKIYILNEHLTILSKSLQILELKEYIHTEYFGNISNVVTRGKYLVFHCSVSSKIYYFDTESKELKVLMTTNKQTIV